MSGLNKYLYCINKNEDIPSDEYHNAHSECLLTSNSLIPVDFFWIFKRNGRKEQMAIRNTSNPDISLWQKLSADSSEGNPFLTFDKSPNLLWTQFSYSMNPARAQQGVAIPFLLNKCLIFQLSLHLGVLALETQEEVPSGEGEMVLGMTFTP